MAADEGDRAVRELHESRRAHGSRRRNPADGNPAPVCRARASSRGAGHLQTFGDSNLRDYRFFIVSQSGRYSTTVTPAPHQPPAEPEPRDPRDHAVEPCPRRVELEHVPAPARSRASRGRAPGSLPADQRQLHRSRIAHVGGNAERAFSAHAKNRSIAARACAQVDASQNEIVAAIGIGRELRDRPSAVDREGVPTAASKIGCPASMKRRAIARRRGLGVPAVAVSTP